jgi:hypothetical protein
MHVSTKMAYMAMIIFLEKFYLQTHSDDLGGMLGELSMLSDGSSADSAALYDWNDAVDSVKLGDTSATVSNQEEFLTNLEAYDALSVFLQEYVNRTNSPDIQSLVQDLIEAKKDSSSNSLVSLWNATIDFVQKNPEVAREMVAFKLFR